jgi:hypothetical protein
MSLFLQFFESIHIYSFIFDIVGYRSKGEPWKISTQKRSLQKI